MKKWLATVVVTALLLFVIIINQSSYPELNYYQRNAINTNHKQDNIYFVFINGLGASCDGSTYNNMDFPEIRKVLTGLGFNFYDHRFLMYSYNGGEVVGDRWIPEEYTASDTGQLIQISTNKLEYLIEQFSFAHPEAKYILVGHSLGGKIAMDFLTNVRSELRNKIKGVVTMNSPLIGSPNKIPGKVMNFLERFNSIWVSPAVQQLIWEYKYANKVSIALKKTINQLQKEGIIVATFSTRQDRLVDATTACIAEGGTPITAGTIVDVNGYSIRDIAAHMQILGHDKVKRYFVSLYINSILTD
ncbi:MAG: hypothetical protein FH758_00450 [Firmicutes bacterium]|nr:hypothetical protein [Bacillota bacterium]